MRWRKASIRSGSETGAVMASSYGGRESRGRRMNLKQGGKRIFRQLDNVEWIASQGVDCLGNADRQW